MLTDSMFVFIIFACAAIVTVVVWIAGDYLCCVKCTRRKCFLLGHDLIQPHIGSELPEGKAVIVCRRCGQSRRVSGVNFYPMFMYLSSSYFKRDHMWKMWLAANEKNPFDKEYYNENEIF